MSLLHLLNTIPPNLAAVLVGLSSQIHAIRWFAEVISWRGSWYESWLALAFWWGICLLGQFTFQYLLPVVIIFIVQHKPSPHPTILTENTLQFTITNLDAIHALLPAFPAIPSTLPLLRYTAYAYIPYLFLTYWVPLNIIIGVLGTVVFTYRAPWFALLRKALLRSAHVRHILSPIPPSYPLSATAVDNLISNKTSTPTLRFLFTVNENQRWWMGLDWTAALMPNERPSWCSNSLQPSSPPSTFSLPSDTVVYTRAAHGGRLRRTAHWAWEEEEWKVVVRREGSVKRVERQVPGATTAKAKPDDLELAETTTVTDEVENEEEENTDPDGWVYGDNKWEGLSGKGGMGKYTRYRRWTRVAHVTETIVEVSEDENGGGLGIVRHSSESTDGDGDQHSEASSSTSVSESPLRQRLRTALKGQR